MGGIFIQQNILNLPPVLTDILNGYTCVKDSTGESTANVFRFYKNDSVFYLKTGAINEIKREYEKLSWLDGKLCVPKVKAWHEQDDSAYLLMTEAPGKMALDRTSDKLCKPFDKTIKAMANGLLMLQAIPITSYPFQNVLDMKLECALYNIENDLIDINWDDLIGFKMPMDIPLVSFQQTPRRVLFCS